MSCPVPMLPAPERTGLRVSVSVSRSFYLSAQVRQVSLWHTTDIFFTVFRLVLLMPFIRDPRCQVWLLCFFLVSGASLVHALDLNLATRAQLRAIKGVGDKLADRILAARERGRFASLEDLAARVAGVGLKKLQILREQGVRVGPLAGHSGAHQSATARSPDGKPTRPDPGQSASVWGNVVVGQESPEDLKRAGVSLTQRLVPAMPMLIRPRPRPGSEPAGQGKGPAGTDVQGKTH